MEGFMKEKKQQEFIIKRTPDSRVSSCSSKDGKVKGHNTKLHLESISFIDGDRNVLR